MAVAFQTIDLAPGASVPPTLTVSPSRAPLAVLASYGVADRAMAAGTNPFVAAPQAAASGIELPNEGPIDYEGLFESVKNSIDPNHLIEGFQNGDPKILKLLEGPHGDIVMQQLKDRLTRVQAFVDALRGISDIYSQALKRAAENIR